MTDKDPNGRLNATILDPQRWGWTAGSGVADLLTPHERARRSGTKRAFLRMNKRKREWKESASSIGDERDSSTGSNPTKRPANEKLQSTETIETTENPNDKRVFESDMPLHLKKPPPSSLPGAMAPVAAASATPKDDNSPAVFSALTRPLTGDETEESLDWYAYHRGRAGLERRDEKTGELRYDVPNPTDTNHSVDEPNWFNTKISVRFPLGMSNDRKSIFRETVVWGWTGDSCLVVDGKAQDGAPQRFSGLLEKSPIEIAGEIAQEYGLTFAETLDLAEYIQGQLRSWVQQEASYAPPMTLTDPHTGQRREKPSSAVTELYGNVIGMAGGGVEDKAAASGAQRGFPIPRRSSSVETSSKKPQKSKPQAQKKETKKGGKLDQKCMEEVRRRLLVESTEEIKKRASGEGLGVLDVREGLSCHLCAHTQGAFAQFACGQDGHSFCRTHIRQKVGLPLDGDPISFAHCPICALHCGCDACTTTLERLAVEFRNCSNEQNCSIEETHIEDLIERARTIRVDATKRNSSRSKQKRTSQTQLTEKMAVPKIPETDLPREVSEGIDVDPGTDADYAAIYSETGPSFPPGLSFSIKPAKADLAARPSFALEDGSVDFCNICRNHGSLLCCDYCPRAFHASCLKSSDVDEQSDGPWECPSCRTEKAGLEEDKVDGTKSLAEISAAYGGTENGSDQGGMLLLLATIHQMLLRLIGYDFGSIFSEPVDTTHLPEYLKIVEKPMDLGTITRKLLDGSYKETGDESLETVAMKALEEIDLVWKNCYLFNVEGSSVYRMALVEERRAEAIREKSVNHLLPDKLAQKFGRKEPSESGRGQQAAAVGDQSGVRPQKSRHKITVSRRSYNGRHIAVLDPDTRKIVKIYSSMQAAGAAVVFLLGLGHRCEWHNFEIDTVSKVRKVVKDAHRNPSCTLFGYRWLMLDNLRSGGVSFPKEDPTKTRTAPIVEDQEHSEDKNKKTDGKGRDLAEFKSVGDAFKDCLKSSSVELNGELSKAHFQSDHHGGRQTLDGNTCSVDNTSEEPVRVPSEADAKGAGESAANCVGINVSNGIKTTMPTSDNSLVPTYPGSQNESTGVKTGSLSTGISQRPDQGGSDSREHDAKPTAAVGPVPVASPTAGEKPTTIDQNRVSNADLQSSVTGTLPNKKGIPVLKNGSHTARQELNGD